MRESLTLKVGDSVLSDVEVTIYSYGIDTKEALDKAKRAIDRKLAELGHHDPVHE